MREYMNRTIAYSEKTSKQNKQLPNNGYETTFVI